jgi:hypothetical protein
VIRRRISSQCGPLPSVTAGSVTSIKAQSYQRGPLAPGSAEIRCQARAGSGRAQPGRRAGADSGRDRVVLGHGQHVAEAAAGQPGAQGRVLAVHLVGGRPCRGSPASELGVEREVPLIRAVLARALLARDDLPGAARCAAAASRPPRPCRSASRALGEFIATAALIRRTGDRPAPATLARAVTELRAVLGSQAATAVAIEVHIAVSSAIDLLVSVPFA